MKENSKTQDQFTVYERRGQGLFFVICRNWRLSPSMILLAEKAAQRLREQLAELFRAAPDSSLNELEEMAGTAFRRKSLHALMGRTNGYYGPYIWKVEELRHYAVELPEGTQDYAVKLLDGFTMKSWLDYISFGETGTGGWSNVDGLIHCVRSAYDLEEEDFQVSLRAGQTPYRDGAGCFPVAFLREQ